ncbi:MAG: methyltransferase, partial [Ktedonobacteraceae bacterium]
MALKELCTAIMSDALQNLGWDLSPDQHFTVPQQCERCSILPKYQALLHAWCLFLAEEGILKKEGTAWRVLPQAQILAPTVLSKKILRQYPDHHAAGVLVINSFPALAAILRGKVNPHETLFPQGNMALLEQLYTNDPYTRRLNALVQQNLQTLLSQLPADRPLRILEIGAGTGGTTSYLLPLLPAERTTYVFTDLSLFFLQQARDKYQRFPFLDYGLLNLDENPQTQGFALHGFDLVIASNVVHATQDLRRSLGHIRELLAPQGLLYLTETTNPLFCLNLLIFSLLDDFWSFQDRDVRPELPMLPVAQWQNLLQECGFAESRVISLLPEEEAPEQAVFVAQSDLPWLPTPKPDVPRQTWLVLADTWGIADQLYHKLSEQQVILLRQGTQYQRVNEHQFTLRPQHADDFQQVVTTLRQQGHTPDHIVYLWGLDDQPQQELDGAFFFEQATRSCLNLLTIVQVIAQQEMASVPRLWVITAQVQQGALGTEDGESGNADPSQFIQAPLYGLVRTIANEHPEMRPTVIDLSTPASLAERDALAEELRAGSLVSEICLRGTQRFLNRLERAPFTQHIPANQVQQRLNLSFHLTLDQPGLLKSLALQTVPRQQPGPGEVAIEVVASGLNFKDIAITMGLIEPDMLAEARGEYILGLECAGRISVLGAGVTGFEVGDEIVALGANCLSPWLIVDARAVVHKPVRMTMEAAAGILAVFLTAHYALHKLAHIQPGERVLIHGAAGGVGLAAIQVVQQVGGEIFATAGTPEKRAYLRTLGVQHV